MYRGTGWVILYGVAQGQSQMSTCAHTTHMHIYSVNIYMSVSVSISLYYLYLYINRQTFALLLITSDSSIDLITGHNIPVRH